jgi:cysteine desulfurase
MQIMKLARYRTLKAISAIAHQYGHYIHSDSIQAFGKIPLDIEKLDLDFATISSHKIGGPLGAAALIYRTNLAPSAHIIGGGQKKA